MKKLKYYTKLYFRFIAMALKAKLAYKVDSFIGILAFFVTNAVNFAVLYLTINAITAIDGYTLENIVFLYGLCLIPKAIDHIFSDNLWALGQNMIRFGKLDQYMTKPLSPFFQIISEKFQLEGLGELILGIIFICIFAPQQTGVNWNFINVTGLIFSEFASCWLFFNIKTIGSCTAFWTKRSNQMLSTLYNFNEFSRYPITIFKNDIIKGILLYVIPFSLFNFCPIACLFSPTGKIDYIFNIPMNIWQVNLVLIGFLVILFSISIILWKRGLKRYESAGS